MGNVCRDDVHIVSTAIGGYKPEMKRYDTTITNCKIFNIKFYCIFMITNMLYLEYVLNFPSIVKLFKNYFLKY